MCRDMLWPANMTDTRAPTRPSHGKRCLHPMSFFPPPLFSQWRVSLLCQEQQPPDAPNSDLGEHHHVLLEEEPTNRGSDLSRDGAPPGANQQQLAYGVVEGSAVWC